MKQFEIVSSKRYKLDKFFFNRLPGDFKQLLIDVKNNRVRSYNDLTNVISKVITMVYGNLSYTYYGPHWTIFHLRFWINNVNNSDQFNHLEKLEQFLAVTYFISELQRLLISNVRYFHRKMDADQNVQNIWEEDTQAAVLILNDLYMTILEVGVFAEIEANIGVIAEERVAKDMEKLLQDYKNFSSSPMFSRTLTFISFGRRYHISRWIPKRWRLLWVLRSRPLDFWTYEPNRFKVFTDGLNKAIRLLKNV